MRRAALVFVALVMFTGVSSATVTSADSITYNSGTSEFFDGDLYAIEVTADGATDKIDITLGESVLSEKVDGEVNQGLSIQFDNLNTELQYSTSSSGELRNIETSAPYHKDGFESEDDAITHAKANCRDLDLSGEANAHVQPYSAGYFSTEYEVYCFQRNEYLGTPAYIDNPDEIFTVDAEVSSDGEVTQSKTLSNGDAGTGVVTDLGSHAKVRWGGNLETGASEPDNSRVLAFYSNDFENGWKVISKDAHDSYTDYMENNAHDLIQDWANGNYDHYDNTEEKISEWVNEDALDAAETVDSSTSDLVNAEVDDSSFETGSFLFDTADLLSYPTFTVYVDAGENGYIEVTKPTGEPEIQSTSGAEIEEDGEGTVTAIVENVGSGEGQFSGRLSSCGSGFDITDDQDTKNLGAGQSATFYFDVSFTSTSSESKTVSGSCDLQVQGLESSDSTSIGVTGVQESECTPGDQTRNQRSDGTWEILECQSNGLTEEVVTVCKVDEKAVAQGDNQFSCVSQNDCEPGDEYREQLESGQWQIFQCKDDGSGYNVKETCGEDEKAVEKGDNFVCEGQGGGVLEQIHLGLSILAGLLVSAVGYKGLRWVDGERQVKGGFKPFTQRGLSRIDRGRFIFGVIGAVVGFAAGLGIGLMIPLIVQLIVILGVGGFLYYFR